MREQDYAVNNSVQAEQLEVSRVLRNTYGLLALTLAFSGVMAFVAQQMRVGYPNIFVVLIGFYGLFFLTNKLRDSAWGLVSAFALTGFMGFLLGPILNRYLGMQGGAEVVSSAFAMTALVFGGLSAYVLITRKDMSFLGGFITAGQVLQTVAFAFQPGAIEDLHPVGHGDELQVAPAARLEGLFHGRPRAPFGREALIGVDGQRLFLGDGSRRNADGDTGGDKAAHKKLLFKM